MPLVIDQPEDDLDNAFIFTSVVDTLRRIKERRQVLMITHNANIAVLGDSELILPMRRNGESGRYTTVVPSTRMKLDKRPKTSLREAQMPSKRKDIYGV